MSKSLHQLRLTVQRRGIDAKGVYDRRIIAEFNIPIPGRDGWVRNHRFHATKGWRTKLEKAA